MAILLSHRILKKGRQQAQSCVAPQDPAWVPRAVVTSGFTKRELGTARVRFGLSWDLVAQGTVCTRVRSCLLSVWTHLPN